MKISIITLFITTLSFAQNFSGRITYDVNVQITDSTYKYSDYQKGKYGDKMEVVIDKNGNFRRDYPNSKIPGFDKIILNVEKNKSFVKFNYTDTIFIGDKYSEPTDLIKIDTLNTEKILGHDCEIFQIKTLESQGENFQIWTTKIYSSKDLKINTKSYKDWKEGNWGLIFNFNQGIFLKMVVSNHFMIITYTAKEIEEIDNINSSLFDYETKKIKKLE